MNTKRKKKEYYQQLYTQKFDKLDEMNQFLERCKLSKFTQGETDNLSIRDWINNFPRKKAPGPDGFTDEFN